MGKKIFRAAAFDRAVSPKNILESVPGNNSNSKVRVLIFQFIHDSISTEI